MRAETLVACLAVAVTGALGAGCATTGARTATPAAAMAPAQAVSVVHGEALSRAEAARFLARFRHVYVGERHASAPHQAVQRDVVEALHAAGAKVMIAVEWLPASAQPALDAFLRGELDEAGLVARSDWARSWGHAFELYAPILRLARDQGLPVVALNVPPGLPSRLVRQGRDGLSAEDRAALPPLDTHDPLHRAWFGCLYAAAAAAHGHHGHGEDEARLDQAYEAQLVWDETMARGVAALLDAPEHAGRVVVVLAGQGHVDWGLGIPQRAMALSGAPFAIVLAAPRRALVDPQYRGAGGDYPERRADLLWVVPSELDGAADDAILAGDGCR